MATGVGALLAGLAGCGDDGDDGARLTPPETSEYATSLGSVRFVCEGTGRLPVVLLAGGADRRTVWSDVRRELGNRVLTCALDRPGVGQSDDPEDPLTPSDVAAALDEVLDQAGLDERFLLVGHSVGGMSLRLFGDRSPDRIAGAVFLDPTVPEVIARYPEELVSFGFDAEATVAEAEAVTTWASDAPVTVLSHDPELLVSEGVYTAEEQTLWDAGQDDYAALTPNGTQRDVDGSGHYIHLDAPGVAAAAIRELLP